MIVVSWPVVIRILQELAIIWPHNLCGILQKSQSELQFESPTNIRYFDQNIWWPRNSLRILIRILESEMYLSIRSDGHRFVLKFFMNFDLNSSLNTLPKYQFMCNSIKISIRIPVWKAQIAIDILSRKLDDHDCCCALAVKVFFSLQTYI